MRKTGCMSAARFFVLKWKGKVNPMESSNEFLGTERIGKLMQKDAIPCIISLLVGALYNIVDQIFIANASYLGSYGNALAGEEATDSLPPPPAGRRRPGDNTGRWESAAQDAAPTCTSPAPRLTKTSSMLSCQCSATCGKSPGRVQGYRLKGNRTAPCCLVSCKEA